MRINSYKELCRELAILLEIPEQNQNIRDCRMILQRVKRLKAAVDNVACLDRVKELNS